MWLWLFTSVPSRLGSPAAHWWTWTDSAGTGLWDKSEGGAPPKRAARRQGRCQQDSVRGLEPAPPGSRIHRAGPPHFLLPAREGPVQLHAAWWQIPQPGLQVDQGPGSTLLPKSDSGMDGPACTEAGWGYRDTARARPGELHGAGVSGSERLQRREHTVFNGDNGKP